MKNAIILLVVGIALSGSFVRSAAALCEISGPTTVSSDQSFRLCAPSQSGYTYEWYGPGVPSGTSSRCVTVYGQARGTYQYVLLAKDSYGQTERCTQIINVGGATGGVGSCTISGPTSVQAGVTAQLCGPTFDPIHRYSWSGPGSFTSTSRCITVTEPGTYVLTSRNQITGSVRNCTHYLEVQGSTGGQGTCSISGPNSVARNGTARLCGPNLGNWTFQWTGPGGLSSSSRCVTIDEAGSYRLTVRNRSTGEMDQCTQYVSWSGTSGGGQGNCLISGPEYMNRNTSARLCGPSGNWNYQWTGPSGFTSSSRCISVDEPGLYDLSIEDRSTGDADQCTHRISWTGTGTGGGVDDVVYDNCPRSQSFWTLQYSALRNASNEPLDVSSNSLRSIAACIDSRSSYFNWSNDTDGMAKALSPSRPITQRKRLARQYAALLANVCAGERGISNQRGDNISLDGDTPVNFGGASNVRELIDVVDRMLRTGSGSFSSMSQFLNQLNNGRGIGPTCQ